MCQLLDCFACLWEALLFLLSSLTSSDKSNVNESRSSILCWSWAYFSKYLSTSFCTNTWPLFFSPLTLKLELSNFIISSSQWDSHMILSLLIWCRSFFWFLQDELFSFRNILVAARSSFSPLLRSFFVSFLCIISSLELILEATCRSFCRLSFEESLSAIMVSLAILLKEESNMY